MSRVLVPLLAVVISAALPAIAIAGGTPPKPAAPAPSASATSSASATASAAPAPSAPSGPETADSLYNQGNEAYDRGDYPLALELYSGAFKLRKSYDVARNLGLTELKLGKLRDAIEHLSYSVEHYPSNRADTKQKVVDWLAQARAQAGKINLTVTPDAAVCTVSGVTIGRDERESEVLVDPGEVKISCGGVPGFGTSKRTLRVDKGATEDLTLSLPREGTIDEPPPPPPPSGYSALPLSTRRTLLFVGIGVTGLALVGGVVSGALSLAKASEADTLLADLRASTGRASPCVSPAAAQCADLLDARRTQDLTGNLAVWTLVGAAGVGAVTAAYLFPNAREAGSEKPRSPEAPAPKREALVRIAPGVGGLVISGSW